MTGTDLPRLDNFGGIALILATLAAAWLVWQYARQLPAFLEDETVGQDA